MRALAKLTLIEAKLFLREPASLFFTLALPLILLWLNGGAGNDPRPELGGRGTLDVLVPGLVAMTLATLGFTGLPGLLAAYRERGVLRRLGATPLPARAVLVAQLVLQLLVGAVGLALLLAIGRGAYGLHAPAHPWQAALAFVLGAGAVFALGFVLAALMPNARAAAAVGAALYFPQIFLAGAVVPSGQLPGSMRAIGRWLPLSPVVTALQDAWSGPGVGGVTLAVLAAIIVLAGGVATRTFRWE